MKSRVWVSTRTKPVACKKKLLYSFGGLEPDQESTKDNNRNQLRQARHPQPTTQAGRLDPIEPSDLHPILVHRTDPPNRSTWARTRPARRSFNPSSNLSSTRRQEPWLCKARPIGLNHIFLATKRSVGSAVAWQGKAWHDME